MNFDTAEVQATLGLRYGNIRKIGAGGMATVFSAYDAVLERSVAVKLVSDARSSANELAVRFQQEARLASRLNHPNIVKVMDFGIAETGILYLIMDLVEGHSLAQVLKESGRMPFETALPIFIQICNALGHAHDNNVIHRDLKPSNIMLTEGDTKQEVRIVDFGLAKVASDDHKITRTGQTVGTPLYASPEQVQSHSVDARADIYSFGCVMMEVLTGNPPFRGTIAIETYEMHINRPPPKLGERGFEHEHSDQIERIVATCLQKDRDDRYSTFRQLRSDLIQLLPEDSRAAAYEESEKYAKNKFTAQSFVKQYRFPIAAVVVLICAGGIVWANAVRQHAHVPTPSLPARFNEPGYTQEQWKFVSHESGGITTWTNIDCRMSDVHFKQLSGKDVRSVRLYAMRLNGSGLKYLRNEPLERLSVAESKIVDENLHYIGDFKGLRRLDISYTWISDKGVESITPLPKLEELKVAGCTKLTSRSMEAILHFAPNVSTLDISYTPVGKAGYELLPRFKNLTHIDVSLSDLTDETFQPILQLCNLEGLAISNNKLLTDTTLKKVQGLKRLKLLKIDDCSGFSKSAIADFEKAMPGVTVITAKKAPKINAGEFL